MGDAASSRPDAAPRWLPVPRTVRLSGDWVALPHAALVALAPASPLMAAARGLMRAAGGRGGVWQLTAYDGGANVRVRARADAHLPAEGYRLRVADDGVLVEASEPAGARHGLATLTQLVRQYGLTLPTLEVEDAPALALRGVMLDVSRGKVPTLATLDALVERLAELKVNHLELYMEHTFAYRDHVEVWAGASPLTGEDVLALDARCRELGVELVPNQNTLGHLTRWLERPRYRPLAECPGGSEFPWGRERPFSLAPVLPESLAFVQGLLDELLPHFSSRLANIGFDETYDVGQGLSRERVEREGKGRVLLGFLDAVCAHVRRHGRTPLYWADMVTRHYPEVIPDLPANAVALEWGYDAEHDWLRFVAPLAAAGRPFALCPGTSSWRSFVGRDAAAEANISRAAAAAKACGAVGLITTDWGDEGHLQPLPVSYWPLALGAALAWGDALPADFDAAVGLHLFGDSTGEAGRVVHRLGGIHARATGERALGAEDSPLVLALMRPDRLADVRAALAPDALERVRAEVAEETVAISRLGLAGPEGELVRHELVHAARALTIAADVLDARRPSSLILTDLLAWQEELRALWPARFRPGGLTDSLGFLAPVERHLAGP